MKDNSDFSVVILNTFKHLSRSQWVYLWIVSITAWSKPSGYLYVFLWFNSYCFSIMVWIVIYRIMNSGLAYQNWLRNKPANLRVVLTASLAIWIFTTRYIYQRPLTVNFDYGIHSTKPNVYGEVEFLLESATSHILSCRGDFWTSWHQSTLAALWKRCIF